VRELLGDTERDGEGDERRVKRSEAGDQGDGKGAKRSDERGN